MFRQARVRMKQSEKVASSLTLHGKHRNVATKLADAVSSKAMATSALVNRVFVSEPSLFYLLNFSLVGMSG